MVPACQERNVRKSMQSLRRRRVCSLLLAAAHCYSLLLGCYSLLLAAARLPLGCPERAPKTELGIKTLRIWVFHYLLHKERALPKH